MFRKSTGMPMRKNLVRKQRPTSPRRAKLWRCVMLINRRFVVQPMKTQRRGKQAHLFSASQCDMVATSSTKSGFSSQMAGNSTGTRDRRHWLPVP